MFEKVKALLIEELSIKAEDITPSAELSSDLGINSLDLADLILQCERVVEALCERLMDRRGRGFYRSVHQKVTFSFYRV